MKLLSKEKDFKGYISDIGGPTANMYGLGCEFHRKGTHCPDKQCLGDKPCSMLNRDHSGYLDVLREASKIKGIKKIFVASGMRYDIFPDKGREKIIREFCANHISGQLKVCT